MHYKKLITFARGPYLLGILSVLLLMVAIIIIKMEMAPAIPGVNWFHHTNVLLVAYPRSWCGCGLNTVLDSAQSEQVECVIVTNADASAIKRITAYHPDVHIVISDSTVHNLVGAGKMPIFWRIHYGLITRYLPNYIPQGQDFM